LRPNFYLHLHPPTIPAAQARWRYTLGAGGTAVFLAFVLLVTGALEMFFYIPTPGEAALSVQMLTYTVPFGGLLRNLHFWAAQWLLVVSAVHLVRVVFTGAYAPPRRFNYLLGLALFVLVILFDFTGYILRWDQGIQWALVVGTNLVKSIPLLGEAFYQILVGGAQIGAATLIRFYAWHVFGLTLLGAGVLFWHIFRVRRDGGIAIPPPALRTQRERIFHFELVRREIAAMVWVGSALLLVSIFVPAPIAPAITEITAAASETHAPWFFLWVQQMLQWGDPFLWGVLAPLVVLLALALIPYALPQPAPDELGRWFPKSNRMAQVLLAALVGLVILLTLLAIGSKV